MVMGQSTGAPERSQHPLSNVPIVRKIGPSSSPSVPPPQVTVLVRISSMIAGPPLGPKSSTTVGLEKSQVLSLTGRKFHSSIGSVEL